MNNNFIDDDEEHIRVLYELKLLDDLEDWELFKKQEEYLDNDVDTETYLKYLRVNGKPIPEILTIYDSWFDPIDHIEYSDIKK
jgi:hypothetical protein